jgi:hypothetical protein
MINVLRQGYKTSGSWILSAIRANGGANSKGENRKHFTLNLKERKEFWMPEGLSLLLLELVEKYSEDD